jgi:hypothetical protein
MSEPKLCPMNFNRAFTLDLDDFYCIQEKCAWWREGQKEYKTEYYGGTVPATSGYCAILDIGR